jgi:hypothetical protein
MSGMIFNIDNTPAYVQATKPVPYEEGTPLTEPARVWCWGDESGDLTVELWNGGEDVLTSVSADQVNAACLIVREVTSTTFTNLKLYR